MNLTRDFGKSLSFPEISRVQVPSKITNNTSQGIIIVIISCQRVCMRTIEQRMPQNFSELHAPLLAVALWHVQEATLLSQNNITYTKDKPRPQHDGLQVLARDFVSRDN